MVLLHPTFRSAPSPVVIVLFILKMPQFYNHCTRNFKLDPLEIFSSAPSIISLLLALQWGETHGADGPGLSWLYVLFPVSFVAFLAVQWWKQDNATVPPRIFLHRSIAAGVAFSCCVGGIMLALSYYLAIWFQSHFKELDALQSGNSQFTGVLSLVIAGMFWRRSFRLMVGYYTALVLLSSCLHWPAGPGLLTTLTVHNPGEGGCGSASRSLPALVWAWRHAAVQPHPAITSNAERLHGSLAHVLQLARSARRWLDARVARTSSSNKLVSGLGAIPGAGSGSSTMRVLARRITALGSQRKSSGGLGRVQYGYYD